MIKEKKKEKYVTTSVILPESLWKKFKIHTVLERSSMSKIIRDILTQYMDNIQKEEGEKGDE